MKKLLTFFYLAVLVVLAQHVNAQTYVTIPDANFRAALMAQYPTCFNASQQLNTTCAASATNTSLDVSSKSISSVQGIQFFTRLSTLNCSNNALTSLPTLPNSISELYCSQNQISVLSTLPSSLTDLFCDYNMITSLPSLPNSLVGLVCSNNNLSNLPALPSSLTYLDCYNNQLLFLPNLPSLLNILDCYNNKLSVLPVLPNSLAYLNCSQNQLSVLPVLPNSLTELSCGKNQLSALPSLPSSLTYFYCSYNQLSVLPVLPNSLVTFYCGFNKISVLPTLPNSLTTLGCSNNNLFALTNLPSSLSYLLAVNNCFTSIPTKPATFPVGGYWSVSPNRTDCIFSLPIKKQTISAGFYHSMSIKPDGTLWAWGYNGQGQLGTGTSINNSCPIQTGTDNKWASVAGGRYTNLGIQTDGSLWAWGYNYYSTIGDNGTTTQTSPKQIGTGIGTDKWAVVTAKENHSLAIRTDGTLFGWGSNLNNQLGDANTTTVRKVPTVIGSDKWLNVATGVQHTIGIQADGTLWGWGFNTYGQVGNFTNINQPIPVRIDNDTKWVSVAAGYFHSIGLKSDGTLWAWGYNSTGQIGNNSNSNQLKPVQIAVGTTWKSIAAGAYHSLGVQTDGSLWTWGNNNVGQLGNNSTGSKIPVRIGTENDWINVAAGEGDQSIGLKADGTVRAWGYNGFGQVGDGTLADRFSPTNVATDGTCARIGANFDKPIPIGTLAQGGVYTDIQNNSTPYGFKNDIGQGSDDIFYSFTITTPSNVIIDHCNSENEDTYLWLYNSAKVLIASNDDFVRTGCNTYQSYLSQNLAPGTYYIASEGYNSSYVGNITTKVSVQACVAAPGNVFANPIVISNAVGACLNYTNYQNNASCFGNDYVGGQASDDIFYKLTLASAQTLSISTCKSTGMDTFIHLLDANGTRITYKDDDNSAGPLCTGVQSSIVQPLAIGTYYIVLEQYSTGSGYMTLDVKTACASARNGDEAVENEAEKEALEQITLFPNPTDKNAYLSIPAFTGVVSIKISDISGRVVQVLEANSSQTEINTSQLSNGIYYLSFPFGDKIVTKKLQVIK